MRAWRAVIVSVLLAVMAGCATVGKDISGVSNFDVVQPGVLYRGGQPSRQGFAELKALGIKTVVNLRADSVPWEKGAAESAGLRYVFLPTSAGKPDARAIQEFLDAVRSHPQPVFVHCKLGRDRTGLQVGAWRIVEQGWTRQRAIDDLNAHGYDWAWFGDVARYLRKLDTKQFAAAPTAASSGEH